MLYIVYVFLAIEINFNLNKLVITKKLGEEIVLYISTQEKV